MGIPGLLKEIGKGERIALSRLSVTHLEKHNRPLRIAIDAAIWNFQTQHGGVGGKNPALRTLFYRLVKLLALPIFPVFVFDGKNKPKTKRGKTVSRYHGTSLPVETSKKLISLFKFPCHVAPGEAEAECAMLQRRGVVDAVMTQDVDAIMFGSGLTLRDWSKEFSKHNKAPTHVSVFDLERLKEISKGLDPEGMILVALLSGGDYDEDGVPGVGCTLACEIARAGFGADLLELVREGDEGIQEWRDRLQYELETNESGYFKIKRKSIKIPDTFPDRTILGFYLNPAITEDDSEMRKLEKKWGQVWKEEIDVQVLRDYVGDTFEWLYKPGAWKLVRAMAPSLLADRLRRNAASSLVTTADQITERRKHCTNDGIPELRVTVVPVEVVGLDLDAEEDSPEYLEKLAAQEDEDDEAGNSNDVPEDEAVPTSPSKKRKTAPWLPWNAEKIWLPETIVELGARGHVERWRQIQQELANDPKKFATRKCRKQKEPAKMKSKGGMQAGAILSYVAATKPSNTIDTLSKAPASTVELLHSPPKAPQEVLRPKVNSKARGAPNTPSKLKSSQTEPGSSPRVLDFFKSSRISQLSVSNKEERKYDNPLTKLMNNENEAAEDPFTNGDQYVDGEPRSSSLSGVNVKTAADESLISFSSPPKCGITEEAINLEADDSVEVEEPLFHVTQRTPRRRSRREKLPVAIEPTNGSPQRQPKKPIESFFKPYLKPSKRMTTSAQPLSCADEAAATAVPPDLTTGLMTAFARAKHVHAVPRESLPGTWKEVEYGAESSVSIAPTGKARASRVSIVDLTTD